MVFFVDDMTESERCTLKLNQYNVKENQVSEKILIFKADLPDLPDLLFNGKIE